MSKEARKIYERMKQTKAGWHSRDFHTLYLGFGFRLVPSKKHDTFRHPRFPQLEDQIPRHPEELSKAYASDAVKLIEALLKLTGEISEDE